VPSIVGISGSASGSSKTLTVVDTVLRRIAERVPAETQLISIAELAPDLGISSREAASPRIEAVLRQIETANLIIAASPVYKGAYTGLFKHLIDLIDYRALLGVPVGLIALGGSEKHALVVEHQLRPLFGFFSARTLPTGVFITDRFVNEGRIEDAASAARLDQLIAEAAEALAPPGGQGSIALAS
jgi:FMN reductase